MTEKNVFLFKEELFMGTTQPIRNKDELKLFLEYYRNTQPSKRNFALISLGLHTALRISDILKLQWNDVYDMEKDTFRSHLSIYEQKTGKLNTIALNPHVIEALQNYKTTRKTEPDDFIFSKNTDYHTPLSRSQAFRIVKHAAMEALHTEHISCHSLRKTFGYHAWKQGTPPALLMDIYNHSSYRVTKKYLGIEQDERDDIFLTIEIDV